MNESTALEGLEACLQTLEDLEAPMAREASRAAIRAVLELHRAGVARIIEIVAASDQKGEELLKLLAQDPLIGGLFALHDVHPLPLEERVRSGFAAVVPEVRGLGFTAWLERITPDEVTVALTRASGRRGDEPKARRVIEEALVRSAPEVRTVFETLRAFVPLEALTRRTREARERAHA
jgi:hypothetical protein